VSLGVSHELAALGMRLAALGMRLAALGMRLAALGMRLAALGMRLAALGMRLYSCPGNEASCACTHQLVDVIRACQVWWQLGTNEN